MADNNSKPGVEPGDRVVIGITFGNSNSSIAYTVDDKVEVIANEDGGMSNEGRKYAVGDNFAHTLTRSPNSYRSVLR